MQVADSRRWELKGNHPTTTWWTMSVCGTMMSPFLTVALYKWDSLPTALASQPLLHQGSVLPFTNLEARGTFIPLVFAWHLNSICVVFISGTHPLHGAVPVSHTWQGEPLEQPSQRACTHGCFCPFSPLWPPLPQPPKSDLFKNVLCPALSSQCPCKNIFPYACGKSAESDPSVGHCSEISVLHVVDTCQMVAHF